MFTKKDYKKYFTELYAVEKKMQKHGTELLKLIDNIEAQKLLKTLIDDEIRHAKLVKDMLKLIK